MEDFLFDFLPVSFSHGQGGERIKEMRIRERKRENQDNGERDLKKNLIYIATSSSNQFLFSNLIVF